MRPPVTYPCNLADLILFGDCAAELDSYKHCLTIPQADRDRIAAMVERMHDAVERLAGADAWLVYGPEEPGAADATPMAQLYGCCADNPEPAEEIAP
ncbi:MAG: hypothetical protein LT080_08245 [Thiobacillus sp.]|nr:hypothetical protein [Thiobacillus sp.]